MSHTVSDPGSMIEHGRVHRRCYTDSDIFDAEMRLIWEKTWIYCGHASQIRNPGDFYSFNIGRQPMLMVRQADGAIGVLYNRCPHRGTQLCAERSGQVGGSFLCPYHGWRFHLDGRLKNLPLREGYEAALIDGSSDAFNMKPAARVGAHRGFVFASLASEGPSLADWLGPAVVAIDSLCDRAPEGEVEIVPTGHRVLQRSNWKFFLENQVDTLHVPFTHESAGTAARSMERSVTERTGKAPYEYRPLSVAVMPPTNWDELKFLNYPHGHSLMQGYLSRSQDPDTLEYEALLRTRVGAQRAEQYLSSDYHHALIYPSLCIQPVMGQIRVIRPASVDRTLSELWHVRLKGASENIYRRYSLNYFNLINSPATLVNADDLENWTRGQRGLSSTGGDWVSFERGFGPQESVESVHSKGTSEAPMRNQFRAWKHYMTAQDERR